MAVELLAPAGSAESLEAALAAGADAVYLGSGRLNARGDKAQFPPEALKDISRQIHAAGAAFYLTLNILLRDDELQEAAALARLARDAGADACIVQDRGLMRLLAREVPDLPVHASTQCTAGTPEAILAYKALNCRRVVLPRELSLPEIKSLTDFAHKEGIEVEVFAHGALCMCVSGQCHMSHFMGGRSANRGDCAQCCRMTYKIERDGEPYRASAAWLSPRDLGAFSILDELVACGIDSLKIEGRLRRADYVGQTTAVYRRALDELRAGLKSSEVLTPERERSLLIAFNRGGSFNQWLWKGGQEGDFLSEKRTGHRGLLLGEVIDIDAPKGIIRLRLDDSLPRNYLPAEKSQISLRLDDGDEGVSAPCGIVRRGRLPGLVELKGFHPKVLRRLRLPLKAWQMNQPSVPEQTGITRSGETLDMRLYEDEAKGFTLAVRAGDRAAAVSAADLPEPPAALDRALPAERCLEQLRKLGGTPYEAGRVTLDALPPWRVKDLNALRRLALEKLAAEKPEPRAPRAFSLPAPEAAKPSPKLPPVIAALPFWRGEEPAEALLKRELLLLLPLSEALRAGAPALRAIHEKMHKDAALGILYPPQLTFELRETYTRELAALSREVPLRALAQGPSGLPRLAEEHGLGGLSYIAFQGSQIWNRETVKALAAEGYTHFLLSPELSAEETVPLLKEIQGAYAWGYGRTEAMFTRFCPIGFSRGYEKCRRCDKGEFDFVDDKGRRFPLRPKPHLTCSFEVWQSEPHEAERALRALLSSSRDLGRAIVLTREQPEEIERIMKALAD